MKFLTILFLFVVAGFYFFKVREKTYPCSTLSNMQYFNYKTQSLVSDKALLIKNGEIFDIVDANKITDYSECKLIDLNGKYLFPGLIDAHTHLLAADRERLSTWKLALEASAARPNMTRVFIGEKNAHSMLMAGFTSVRDLGNSGHHLDELLKKRLEQSIVLGPRMITSGPGLAMAPSQINLKYNSSEYTLVDNTTDINSLLKNYRKHGHIWLKVYADNSVAENMMQEALLQKITLAAQNMNFKVAIHTIFANSTQNALLANPDSIEHFYEIPNLDVTKPTQNKPFAVLTDMTLKSCVKANVENNCMAKSEELKKRISWLKENNYKLVFGSDAVLDFTANFKNRGDASLNSLLSLNELGLSPLEVIMAATATAGEMLTLPVGKIEFNYFADLVVYSKNPLNDLSEVLRPEAIMFKGKFICQHQSECRND